MPYSDPEKQREWERLRSQRRRDEQLAHLTPEELAERDRAIKERQQANLAAGREEQRNVCPEPPNCSPLGFVKNKDSRPLYPLRRLVFRRGR